MKFTEKVKYFRNQLKELGIREFYAIPFYYKLFWKMGLHLPPPYFNNFLINAVIHGIIFGIFWSFLFWLIPYVVGEVRSLDSVLLDFLIGFILFGPTHAYDWHRKSKKWNFGKWVNYPDSVQQRFDGA